MKILKAMVLSAIIYSTALFAGNQMPMNLASVAEALEKLREHPSANISWQGGWTIISLVDKGDHVVWFFAPEEHAAYPAVIQRTISDKNGGIEIVTTTFCESSKQKCDALASQFKKLNEKNKKKR